MNIKELADEAGFNFEHIYWTERDLKPLMGRFAELVAAHEAAKWDAQTSVEIHEAVLEEREECAKMVDHILKEGGGTYGDAIRARSKQALAQPPLPVQPSEEWPGQSNIESPHNACQHRGYCKQMKEQPVQKPVKCAVRDCPNHTHQGQFVGSVCFPCYTTPPQRTWVGLTDEELADLWYKESLDWMEFARAHEAELKEKNT